MDAEKKNLIDRVLIAVLTSLVIPLLVWIVTSSVERDKVRQEYVRIAIGVLQPPKDAQAPQRDLRRWAVQIIQETAPVKIPADAIEPLINGESSIPVDVYDLYFTPDRVIAPPKK